MKQLRMFIKRATAGKPFSQGRSLGTLGIAGIALALAAPAMAQDDEAAELAKKLANPVASLI
jgi:hypothetical protein